jgi:hypothetical protein|tara:strand:- start:139 stop:378 length:240 start_codon:yes stop_codon:yes gene_type:complete
MSSPFSDTAQDKLLKRVMQELMQIKLAVLALEEDCDSLRQSIEEFEDELLDELEQEDGDTSDDSVDIPTLVRRHRRRSR